MGLRSTAAAFLLGGTSALLAADGRALLVDDFEAGGVSLVAGCPFPPGSSWESIETGLAGAVGGRRETSVIPTGPLPDVEGCMNATQELTFVSAELVTGAEDDGMLFIATNNLEDSLFEGGAYFGPVYRMLDSSTFDLTDGGASDTLQIAFSEVGGPFVLRVWARSAYEPAIPQWPEGHGRFDVASSGVLSIPFESLFGGVEPWRTACPRVCPDLSRLEYLHFEFYADSGAQNRRIRISDIRSVPEPATAALLLGGIAALGFRARRISRRAGPARPCR